MKILKFGAVWCPACHVMKKIFKQIEEELDWLDAKYFDYDTHNEIAKKYKIEDVLPVFIFLNKDETEFLRLHGEIPKDELMHIIKDNKDK